MLEATFELLRARGFAGTTVDAIAVVGGVSKATIYANWKSKTEIVVELLGRFADDAALMPDTGELRGDLELVIGRFVQLATQLEGVGLTVIAESAYDPVLAAAVGRLTRDWRDHQRELLHRAVERGLVPADIDEELAADLVAAMVHFRIFIARADDTAEALSKRLAELVLSAWGADV